METVLKAIADWIKGILTAGIMSNLSGLFDDVNTQVGNIAQQVGTKPSSFEPRVFAMIESLSRNVVLPIAGIILTFIACYELIEMITQHNNMAQFEPALIMRWIFKTAISVWLISNTFDIVMAVFDVTQKVVSDSSSIIAGNTRVNDIGLSMLQSSLMQMDIGPLFGLFLQSFFIGITMRILSIVIFVIVYGRMIEIYCMVSLAPIPMATFGNHEQSHMGQNYLKCLFALGFQGFLILICVAIYSSIKFELSFVNMATDSTEFEKSIRIPFQKDGFDDVRAEYSQMLRQQLAKGNNGLTKTKFITFGVEGESMAQVKPRLDHIQNDLLNNFHRLGVQAKSLNGVQRLKLMHDMFNMDGASKFHFDWKDLVKSGLSAKDAIAPTAFAFKNSRTFQMGGMDINANYSEEDNPLSLKADFILSLCELVVGGKEGLLPVEKTVIDRCVHLIYRKYFANPCPENMPILEDLYNALLQQEEKEAHHVATALEIYVKGSLNLFNHRTNVNINNRIVCYDIKELGKQMKKLGMLIVQDQVWGRVTANRSSGKSTRYYMDEMHLLLKEEQTAAYSVEIWKRFRKWGGIPTGLTQNVKDLLSSREVENIFENSDMIIMLNQAAGDRQILAKQLNISPHQLSYVTHSGEGEGLLFFGNVILPFVDRFPTDLELYRIMTTKLGEVSEGAQK